MKITSLALAGFRNLQKTELEFPAEQGVHVFLGKNGQGKTNLLEAVYLCSLTKSFRTRANSDLIGFGQDFCRIQMLAQVNGQADKLEMVFTREPAQKAMKINGIKKSAADFMGQLKVVFFSPDDLASMAFAPKLRRRYLDVLLSQLSHDYFVCLSRYEQARKQRNALLRQIKEGKAQRHELMFWDNALSEFGLPLIEERKQVTAQLQEKAAQNYRQIAQEPSARLELEYLCSLEETGSLPDFKSKLSAYHEKDILLASTQRGPHRDDLRFWLNGQDMAFFASRGEWRSLILALKLAEVGLLKERTGNPPILLLDDVFSELDEGRQKYLFQNIGHLQTFITTTHREFLTPLDMPMKVWEVKERRVEEF